MSYLDKTFCASPHCNNDCGRRMTDERKHQRLIYLNDERVSYGYFCGEEDRLNLWLDPESIKGILDV